VSCLLVILTFVGAPLDDRGLVGLHQPGLSAQGLDRAIVGFGVSDVGGHPNIGQDRADRYPPFPMSVSRPKVQTADALRRMLHPARRLAGAGRCLTAGYGAVQLVRLVVLLSIVGSKAMTSRDHNGINRELAIALSGARVLSTTRPQVRPTAAGRTGVW
jgi:hypothetical protein